jgi:predicted enzyme related to lactoylglutathione lyase
LTRIKLSAVLLTLIVAGCATVAPELPAITDKPTGSHFDGRIVWHDLLTTTPAESRKFYGELFGWKFERPGLSIGIGDADSYMLIRHNGELIGGMLDANILNGDDNISQWITVMSTEDLSAAVERVAANGGEILTPPTDVGSRGTLAVVAGPDKAIIALVQTRGGDPEESEPVVNGWLWNELWTNNVEQATSFYQAVAGFEIEDHAVQGADHDYRVLKSGDSPRAAIMPNPFERELPVWVNYIRVDDPAAITARVEELGGVVFIDASPRALGGEVAFVAGPSGAGVALQTWPLDREETQ